MLAYLCDDNGIALGLAVDLFYQVGSGQAL